MAFYLPFWCITCVCFPPSYKQPKNDPHGHWHPGWGLHPMYNCITQPLWCSSSPKVSIPSPPDDRCGSETWLEVLEATWNLRTPRQSPGKISANHAVLSNKIGFSSTYLEGNLHRKTQEEFTELRICWKMTYWRMLFGLENPRKKLIATDITRNHLRISTSGAVYKLVSVWDPKKGEVKLVSWGVPSQKTNIDTQNSHF